MTLKWPGDQLGLVCTFTAQIPPLNEADQALVRRAMAEIGPDWAVELHGLTADEATLVVLPEDGDDAMGPSFMISRETYGLRVDQVHWDAMTEIGVYATLVDVVAALHARLAFGMERSAPPSITLH